MHACDRCAVALEKNPNPQNLDFHMYKGENVSRNQKNQVINVCLIHLSENNKMVRKVPSCHTADLEERG